MGIEDIAEAAIEAVITADTDIEALSGLPQDRLKW
jgi:hypothetical protein